MAEDAVLVTGVNGPLEDGWQTTVGDFAHRVLASAAEGAGHRQGGA